MDIKKGDMFRQAPDGMHFNDVAVLESQDGKRQVLTGVNTLKLKSFYLKKENKDL